MRRMMTVLLLLLATAAFAGDDPADYERILLPITTGNDPIPGANGSLWETKLTIHNRFEGPLNIQGPFCDPSVSHPPQPCRLPIQPKASELVRVFSGRADIDTGAFLHIIRNANFERLPLALRVRDLSKNAQSFGTRVPAPHTSEFLDHVILTDVPTDPRYRATLRIYSADEAPRGGIKVRVYTLTGTTPIEEHTVELQGKNILVFDPTPDHPAFAQMDPLTPTVRAAAATVRIEIEDPIRHVVSPPPPPLWAMVSITNNETQQVTIIDP